MPQSLDKLVHCTVKVALVVQIVAISLVYLGDPRGINPCVLGDGDC